MPLSHLEHGARVRARQLAELREGVKLEFQLDAVSDRLEADGEIVESEFGDDDADVEEDTEDVDEEQAVDDSAALDALRFEHGLERLGRFVDVDGTDQCVLECEANDLDAVVDICWSVIF